MRKVGSFDSRKDAEKFHWYLLSKEIENQLDEDPPNWEIWVHNDDYLDQARSDLSEYQQSPTAEKFQVSAPKKKAPPKPERTSRPPAGAPSVPLTRFLIVACVLLSIYTGLGSRQPEVIGLLRFSNVYKPDGWIWPVSPDIAAGQVWRLVTPMFIHLSMIHLVMNMYWMWILAGFVERVRGSGRLVILTLVTAAGAHMTEYVITGPFFFGISGVVYGLLGYFWMKSMVSPEDGFHLPETITLMMLIWLFLGLTGSLKAMGINVANGAHLGGLIMGMILGTIRSWR